MQATLPKAERCECGELFRRARTAAKGTPIRLDAEPSPAGYYVLEDRGWAQIAAVNAKPDERPDEPHYTAHTATCPIATYWRGVKQGAARARKDRRR